ncbi:MAG: Galactokinase, partial [Spartobacteria bacterium]|nr:Galactokinase [Spartobacteria bacterium]
QEGLVLGAAIDRGLTIRGTSREDGVASMRSSLMGEFAISLAGVQPQTVNRWSNYVLGVAAELISAGISIRGFSAEVSGNLPARSGLSSSAALEVATALFLLKLYHRELPPMELAKLCQRAEHRFAGVKSGLLDPVMSVFGRSGHAIFFDTRTEEVRIVPFPNDLSLIIAESGIERELSDGKYNARREETFAVARALGISALRDVSIADLERRNDIEPILRRRALHIAGENERVRRAVLLLEQGKAAEFGELMNASHESSRKLFENSTTALDLLVNIATKIPGVLGARLTGAGFGGATISLCQRSRTDAAVQELRHGYEKQTGIAPSVFVCEIADGAG